MATTLDKMISDLESIGRDPTNYRYYYVGKSSKNIDGDRVFIETSPESEFFEEYGFKKIYNIWKQFNFSPTN